MDAASPIVSRAGSTPPFSIGLTWGVVAGLVLVAVLVAAVAWMWWRQRRNAAEKDLAILRSISMPSYRQMTSRYQLELERARRFERSLSMVVVRLDGDEPRDMELVLRRESAREREARIVAACGHRIAFAHVGLVLQECLRDMDLAACDVTARRYVVVLPECTRTDAAGLVKRVELLVRRGTGLGIRTGIAEAGADGMMVADIVQKAAERMARGPGAEVTPARFPGAVGESRVSA